MRYRVLGPLEISGARGELQLAAPRQRVVLAALLLEANHVVSVDRLVDAVWDESPPSTARSQIQICMSALRRALALVGATDTIETQAPGYLFRVVPDEVDLHVFDRLAGASRAATVAGQFVEAADLFAQALTIWRGAPFAGVDSRLIQSAALSLNERHQAVVEESIDVELMLGHHHEMIGQLLVLTAEHPVRERLRAQLMTALYRDGRQAEALDAYRQARRALVSELGLEPGRDLQRLEKAILDGDPDLELNVAVPSMALAAQLRPHPPPRQLRADIADFTGREGVLAEIHGALVAAVPEAPAGIVAITGKGGVGKTTVAVHAAHELSGHFPDGQLYVDLRGGEPRPVSPAQVLERFLRALGVSGPAIPEGVDERAEIYRDRLAGRRLLIVFDDAANEDQIIPLLPGSGGCAVIVTSRLRLTGLSGARRIELGVLEPDPALRLLGHVAGTARVQAEADTARTLVDLCGGLPLALRIAGARLAARPHWTVAQLATRLSDEHRRLDELMHGGVGIRTSIAVAYEGLTPAAQRLFRRLGVLESPDFAAWVSIPLLDTGHDDAEDLLESLVDIQLLDVQRLGRGPARYRFHDLIRIYAREQLLAEEPAEERSAAVRRVLSCWLGLAREAHRREYGGDFTVLHGSAPLWPLPAPIVDELLAEPMQWYEAERVALVAAVRRAADNGLDELCWDLAMTTVTLFEAHSYLDDWRETHEIALGAARAAGNRRAEAAMLYSLGALSLVERRFEDSATQLEQALRVFAELGDAHGCGLAQRNLAYLDRVRGDFPAALDRYEQALHSLRIAGDAIGEAHALSNMAQVLVEQHKFDVAEELLAQALRIARAVGARRVEAQTLHRLGESFVRRGDLAQAGVAFQNVLDVVCAVGDQVGEAYTRYGLGVVQLGLGQHEQAERFLVEAHRLAMQTGERMLTGQICVSLADVCRGAGRPVDALARLDYAEEIFEQLGAAPWVYRTAEVRQAIRSAS